MALTSENVRLVGPNRMDKLNDDHGWRRVPRRAAYDYISKDNGYLAAAAANEFGCFYR